MFGNTGGFILPDVLVGTAVTLVGKSTGENLMNVISVVLGIYLLLGLILSVTAAARSIQFGAAFNRKPLVASLAVLTMVVLWLPVVIYEAIKESRRNV
jgi:hypothetical protein